MNFRLRNQRSDVRAVSGPLPVSVDGIASSISPAELEATSPSQIQTIPPKPAPTAVERFQQWGR